MTSLPRSSLSRTQRLPPVRRRVTVRALTAVVVVVSLTPAGSAVAKHQDGVPRSGAELHWRLVGGRPHGVRGHRTHQRAIEQLGREQKLGHGVEPTLDALIHRGQNGGESALSGHHKFLFDAVSAYQISASTYRRRVSLLNKIARALGYEVDFKSMSPRDALAHKVLCEVRRDGCSTAGVVPTGENAQSVERISWLVEAFFRRAKTYAQIWPRGDALRVLSEHFDSARTEGPGASLREAIESLIIQPRADAEETIAAAVEAQNLDHTTALTRRNRLKDLYDLAEHEGIARGGSPVPANADRVSKAPFRKLTNAGRVLEELPNYYSHNTEKTTRQALERLRRYVGWRWPGSVAAVTQEEALALLLRLPAAAAVGVVDGFEGWLQQSEGGGPNVSENSAKQYRNHLSRCVKLASKLNLVELDLPSVSVDASQSHRKRITEMLGPAPEDASRVDAVLAGGLPPHPATEYPRVGALYGLANLLPELSGELGSTFEVPQFPGVRHFASWLLSAPSERLGPLLGSYFDHLAVHPDLVEPADHLEHLRLVRLGLEEIQASARKLGWFFGVAASDLKVPPTTPTQRRFWTLEIDKALGASVQGLEWVREVLRWDLTQTHLGPEGRYGHNLAQERFRVWASTPKESKTRIVAFEQLFLDQGLLGPFLESLASEEARRYQPILEGLIERARLRDSPRMRLRP